MVTTWSPMRVQTVRCVCVTTPVTKCVYAHACARPQVVRSVIHSPDGHLQRSACCCCSHPLWLAPLLRRPWSALAVPPHHHHHLELKHSKQTVCVRAKGAGTGAASVPSLSQKPWRRSRTHRGLPLQECVWQRERERVCTGVWCEWS